MSRGVELVLVTRQETISLPKAKPTVAECDLVVVIMKYNEPIFNQQNERMVKRIPRDWNKHIHNVNKLPRPNFPRCTYYHQIGHLINEYPFIEDNARQGFVNISKIWI
jgi:hypothetical protein